MPKQQVVFIHLLKTGGTTFRSILRSIYGEQFFVCQDPSIGSVEAALATYECVEFHVATNEHQSLIGHSELFRQRRWDLLRNASIFTMFRDPVDQYLSYYYYLCSIRPSVEPFMNSVGLKFPGSIEEMVTEPISFNDQLAFLLGRRNHGDHCVNQADLEDAKKILVDLDVHVGLTERFSDAVNVFEAVTQKTVARTEIVDQNRNAARPPRDAVAPSIIEQIRKMNYLDQALYDFGRELLYNDLSRIVKPQIVNTTYAPSTSGRAISVRAWIKARFGRSLTR